MFAIKPKDSPGSVRSLYSSRRRIEWSQFRNPTVLVAGWIATASGAGLFPVAPGTMGTLVGVPLAILTQSWAFEQRCLFWGALTVLGTWAARVFDQAMQTSDNQNIVIDEVIGLGIAAWSLPVLGGSSFPSGYGGWVVAFLLFRFFDVLKPPPVRWIDRWSKKQTSPWWKGFGVIADDIVAGFQGLIVILLLQKWQLMPS